jgi:hypothetical protein
MTYLYFIKAYPALYNWTTFPLTTLLEHIWDVCHVPLDEKSHPDPTAVELCSALERALNFMHTGNVSVIATSAMNPLWIGLSVIHDGHPCINPAIVPTFTSSVLVNASRWPRNKSGQVTSASKGSQIRTYGPGHFNVCYLSFHISWICLCALTHMPFKIKMTDKVESVRLCRSSQLKTQKHPKATSFSLPFLLLFIFNIADILL